MSRPPLTRQIPVRRVRLLALSCLAAAAAMSLDGCGSSSTGTPASKAKAGGQASEQGGSGTTDQGAGPAGFPDFDAICPKLPVADAQALIRPTIGPAVADTRLGGCTFVPPGHQLADNNLTVSFENGGGASKRYDGDVNGTFSAGGATIKTGGDPEIPLSGVGDKAVWTSTVGYPSISALKGNVYCRVSTSDDAPLLTIIGTANNPLPVGTKDQQAQYAQLEGKLCVDLFGLVH